MTTAEDTGQVERKAIEQAVVGSMVLMESGAAAEFAGSELTGNEFTNPGLRAMFRAVCSMTAQGRPVDTITLAEQLITAGQFETAGGAIGIAEVMEAVPHAAHVRHYVRQLATLHQRDRLLLLSDRLRNQAEDLTEEPSEIVGKFINEMEAIRAGNVGKAELISAAQALESMEIRETSEVPAISSGLNELDRQLNGGFRPGQLIVWGGRPGSGKSAMMDQVILTAGKDHHPGLIASLEMTPGEIAGRALKTIQRQRFVELPVWFTEASDITKLAAMLRLAKRRHGIRIAAVDYLQLIESASGKSELRERQVANMSRSLKRLAMELEIPILLGSQLNRASEGKQRPSLADLRESGAIEQDADIVILIHGDSESDERELFVAKHRGGPCGVVKTTFDRPKFWFHDAGPWTGAL